MGSWTREDEERVSPTARWLFRGLWTVGFVLLVAILVGVVIGLLARLL